ncbi:MAG: hypothetical protein KC442_25640, partial [Thermomicrobiales bacterium]|nr:hypothetical protein [Thermomicrobiales bacterium]
MIRKLALVLALVAVLLAPSVVRAQSAADLIVADLDAYWSTQFAERGLPYSSPRFSVVDYPGMEMCGFLDMFDAIGAYCSSGSTLTLSSGYVDPNDIVSVLTILSHEYGHHIQ